MANRKRLLVLTIFLAVAVFIGCERRESRSGGESKQAKKYYITLKGSDTMVHLASSWAEAFMKANPGVEVSVTGGGSGTGIAALLNGTTDIAAASRKMKKKEYDIAERKEIEPREIVVARDGIAVVVNRENPLSEVSLGQLGEIFTGVYSNWEQVGGPNEKIVVLSRDSSSGTYVFFQEHVLKRRDYATTARLMPATSAIIRSVSADRWAIGYAGLGYAAGAGEKVKMLSVKENKDAPAIAPSEESVKSEEYSIARPLHLYTAGPPSGPIKKFVDFCLSPDGQRIVRETGYVTVN